MTSLVDGLFIQNSVLLVISKDTFYPFYSFHLCTRFGNKSSESALIFILDSTLYSVRVLGIPDKSAEH